MTERAGDTFALSRRAHRSPQGHPRKLGKSLAKVSLSLTLSHPYWNGHEYLKQEKEKKC